MLNTHKYQSSHRFLYKSAKRLLKNDSNHQELSSNEPLIRQSDFILKG